MPEALRDRFANIMTFTVTESAAGTVTFAEVITNVGIDSARRSGVAILIDEIDYYIDIGTLSLMTTDGDDVIAAITISNNVPTLHAMNDRRILDGITITRQDYGVAAGGGLVVQPFVKQFFPPLIMAERSIYLGATGVGLATPATVSARIFYRTHQITAEEFVEIAEVFRLVS